MLCALLLSSQLQAAETAKIKNVRIVATTSGGATTYRVTGSSSIDHVAVEIKEGSTSESVSMTESDAVAHGTALLRSLPTASTSSTLKVYDSKGSLLQSFSGTLDELGNLDLTVQAQVCTSKTGCPTVDLELRGALIQEDTGGYSLDLELNGADVWSAGSAVLSWTESSCSKLTGCVSTSVSSSVAFDSLDSVWEGSSALEMDDVIEVKATAYDSKGKKLDEEKADQSLPWDNGGNGLPTVSIKGDPQTRLAFWGGRRGYGAGKYGLDLDNLITVVSDGWTSSTLPATASLELDGGSTWTLPVQSYQRTTLVPVDFKGTPEKESFSVSIDGVPCDLTAEKGVCLFNGRVILVEDQGSYWLSVTAWADVATDLPASVKVGLTGTTGVAATLESTYEAVFDAEVAVVF